MYDIGVQLILTPPWSPDINPIEKSFHPVEKIEQDASRQNRKQESYHQFSDHVKETILNFTVVTIDKITEYKVKQMSMVIKKKWQRLRC